MRTMFYEFPNDPTCWGVEDQYMFGGKYLCVPVLKAGQRVRGVYLLKECKWRLFEENGKKKEVEYEGGKIDCPIESMPVLVRQ
jgi:alpha-D-xyloside xylohydrolase